MAVNATGAVYNDPYGMYAQLLNKNTSENGAVAAVKGISFGGNIQTYASGLLSTDGRAQLSKTIKAMKDQGYTNFSFEDIENYRNARELEFAQKVKADIRELGVDENIAFRLVADTYGTISVITDHPDKTIVELYIAANPDMAEEIQHIQSLANLRRVVQNTQVRNAEGAIQLKKSLQAEAVEAFFAMNDNNGQDWFSQIAAFDGSSESAQFMLGLGSGSTA